MHQDEDDPQPQTCHYGVVAKWWAEFNTSGPEIAYFLRFVESGQPALDVACGTGRLFIPTYRRRELPGGWPDPGDRRTGSDGAEYELRGRLVDVDPLAQQVAMEMPGFMWRDGSSSRRTSTS
ncbi:MAG: hypothetical protein ACRDG8_00695 [Actinomycetota bacterium]